MVVKSVQKTLRLTTLSKQVEEIVNPAFGNPLKPSFQFSPSISEKTSLVRTLESTLTALGLILTDRHSAVFRTSIQIVRSDGLLPTLNGETMSQAQQLQ